MAADTDRSPGISPTLVGRDNALRKITDALAGGSALVIVEGEAGIGKTRLLREALTVLGSRQPPEEPRALLATCPAVTEPAPLSAIVTGIRRWAPNVGTLGLSALGGALRPLFPEWADDLPPALEPIDDPGTIRHVLFRALTELIERLGLRVLAIEDVHYADSTTLEWLLTLCADEATGERDLSIVLTFRPWDVSPDSLLPRLTTRTPPGMSRVRIELTSLSITDVRHLVASAYDSEQVSGQFAEFLHSSTDGIPLVVEEFLLLLEDREDIIREDGKWARRVLNELSVPATVRDSVLERVRRLDGDSQRLLEAASILADPADEGLLAAVADLDRHAARRGVARALTSGLLREHSPGQFTFRHMLDAQAIREALPVSERRRLHARAAAALRRGNHPPVAQLAHHFQEAGDVGHWCEYAIASADIALESGDDRTAVQTLLQVVTSVEHPIDRRVQLARKLGRAAFFGATTLGDLADQVVAVLRRVLTTDEIASADRGDLRLLLGRMLWAVGQRSASFEQWEQAVPDLDHRPDLAIRTMANLALPLNPDWPASRHRQWLDRAGGLLDRVSAQDRQAFLDMRMSTLLLLGDEAGWDALFGLPDLTSNHSDERDIANTLINVVWAALAWGRFDDARKQLKTCRALIEASDYSRLTYSAPAAEIRLDWYVGNWSRLDSRIEELLANDEGDSQSRFHAKQVRGLLHVAAGDRSAAQRELDSAAEEQARLGVIEPEAVAVPAARARLLLADRDADAALAVTRSVVDVIERKNVWMWVADIASVHVDALLAAPGTADAEDFVVTFAHNLRGRNLPAAQAALATCQAILTANTDGPYRAADQFAEAAKLWAVLPRPYDELLACERQGMAMLDAGKTDMAMKLLADTQRRLYDLGATWDSDRVAHVVREYGGEVARTWRGGRRGYGDQLSPRELDVVRLIVEGRTNRQAAETLYVSPRTVEGHVKSAMRKLGVTSRTALAIAAVKAGLVAPPAGD